MEKSRDSTQDKCNEDLFVAVLLLCGPDPEPDTGEPSDIYSDWWDRVQVALRELGAEPILVGDYNTWLQKGGMAWRD